MVVTDGRGLPLGTLVTSASPYEGNLLEPTLNRTFAVEKILRIVADKGYDDDRLRKGLAEEWRIDLIAPNKRHRVHKTQDGRKLRRYSRRWIVERTMAWLHNYRRLVTRWERHVAIYTAFVHVACILLILNRVLK